MAFLFNRAPGIAKEVDNWAVVVQEIAGPGVMSPQTVIKNTQAWNIQIQFREQGPAAIVGNWVVDAYVESIGPGAELNVGQAVAAFGGAGAVHNLNIPVAAGAVPVTAGQQTTPYILIITLTANQGAAGPWLAMAGFEEGPILQFYV